ncbi:PEP-CTERM sorting domain-containing protein [Poriferisphaera sp. WC338]|uniref:PEP-CTERM sorting domain-containing protein n=1 Tax=Poriferisphaera sp. WC338 TaxID=3425129 RepID=UPI003D81A787
MKIAKISIRALITSSIALACSTVSFADIAFMEGDFDPGSYSDGPTIVRFDQNPGASYSATSSQFDTQNLGKVIIQIFDMTRPTDEFNVVYQPIFLTDFIYDPTTEGAIASLTASAKTFSPTGTPPFVEYGVMRVAIKQNNKIYFAGIEGFSTDDDTAIRNKSGLIAEDFIEMSNGFGDPDSHPDFAGDEMQFGFTVSMTTTFLPADTQRIHHVGFDDVTVRIDSAAIPEPASFALLGLGSLAMLKRRMRSIS